MAVKIIPLNELEKLFAAVALTKKLYLPVEKAGQYDYAPWEPGTGYDPEVLHTVKSAKGVFFPQSEDLVRYKRDGFSLSIAQVAPEDEDFVVFGVHACDVAGFEVLDRVFLSDPVDTYYKARREHGTVVSVMCAKPEETCFCGTFGIDAEQPGGDVQSWISGDTLYMEALTQKGEALLDQLDGIIMDGNDAENRKAVNDAAEEHKEIMRKLPLADLTTDGFGKEADLLTLFGRPEWKELSSSCLGCGTCTYVCPTCQCYDIREYDTGHGISRFRVWDSCMYSDFTMMAHGSPRPDQLQRFRQRFMHKLKYYPDNYDGAFSCVGCGRCLQKCPISMNIVKVMKKLGGADND
ncbi:MAG: 4Fe-4S dicluster domain-containing protein [Clostridia bacterium]|nr:4Fe-4S dicluster domain-containing protein [Clostridia bacterium]